MNEILKQLLTILSLLIPSLLWGQEFNIQLSEKHLNKVEDAESGKKKLKKYRKYYQKDSAKIAKKEKKYWKAKSDSLSKATYKKHQEELAQQSQSIQNNGIDTVQAAVKDSVGNYLAENEQLRKAQEYNLQDKDSLNSTAQEYREAGTGKAQNTLTQQTGLSEDELSQVKQLQNGDSAKNTVSTYSPQGAEYAQTEAAEQSGLGDLEQQQEEFLGQQETLNEYNPEEYTSQVPHEESLKNYQDEAMQDMNANQYEDQANANADQSQWQENGAELAKEKAVNFFETKVDVLTPVQTQLGQLQQKYQSVANSNNLDNAIKRNSLEGKPLIERLFIGGQFNVNSTDPISLDLSPKLGYKINKRWVVGIGGTYRKTFSNDTLNTNLNIPKDGYGYSGFTSYDAFRGFFVYGEYERLSNEVAIPDSESTEMQWVDGLMLGVGRKFKVHPKVDMQVIAMYNFLHDEDNALYPKPYTIKVGFNLSQLALLKR